MQILDIINEASIFSRDTKYTYGHHVRVSNGSAKGKELITKIQKEIKTFNPDEKLEWVKTAPAKSPVIKVGNGDTVLYFKRIEADQSVFGIEGSPSGIETGLLHADKFNRGDIAEAVLGASLTAKLIKRGSDRIGRIGIDEVQQVLKNCITKSNTEVHYPVHDQNSMIADNIEFSLRLPSGSMMFIKNPKNWPRVEDLFHSAIMYVNDADIEKYSNHFYKNGKVDEIRITSDGVSDQKGRKTDVNARIKDASAPGGWRPLKNVDISLKADSDIYGQHGAGGLQGGPDKWLASANGLFKELGISFDMPARGKNDILKFWIAIYKQAVVKLNTELANASATKTTLFIEHLADLIMRHGSGLNQDKTSNRTLKLISFKNGGYTQHSFALLKNRLIRNNITLEADLTLGPRSGKPSIIIRNANEPHEVLTAIRYFQGEDKASNYFEKGPLLHSLTQIIKDKGPVPDATASTTATKVSADPAQNTQPNVQDQTPSTFSPQKTFKGHQHQAGRHEPDDLQRPSLEIGDPNMNVSGPEVPEHHRE
jgi:hypothetical protein